MKQRLEAPLWTHSGNPQLVVSWNFLHLLQLVAQIWKSVGQPGSHAISLNQLWPSFHRVGGAVSAHWPAETGMTDFMQEEEYPRQLLNPTSG
jgi:hypothetical protein